MKTCIYLSYKGLGANLLHLSYCHEIAKKYGSVTIITLCNNLEAALKDDPLIEKVVFISEFHKRFIDVLKLKKFLNTFNFDQIFIYYPSLRIYLASIFSNIKKVYCYLNSALDHHRFYGGNGFCRIQTFRASFCAVHNSMTPVELKWVFKIIQTLSRRLVTAINNPAVGV